MRLGFVIPLAVSALIAGLFLSVRTQRCDSVDVVEFSAEIPYLEALILLGNKSRLESLVAAGGIEVTDREWDGLEFGKVHRFSSWEASGRGRFKARSLSGEFPGEMSFIQETHADRDGMCVKSEMSSPCGYVKSQATEISISSARPVVVRVENRLSYERPLPFWLSEKMRSRVAEHNKSRAEAIAEVIRSALNGHPAKTAHQ